MKYGNEHPTSENIGRAVVKRKPNIYSTVSEEVADEMGIKKSPNTSGYNDDRDAFRHAYTSALITYRYGYGAAKNAGDLNEVKNNMPWADGNPPHEEWMDQRNNATGRDIAIDVQLKGGNEQDLKIAVKQALDDGRLVTSPYDPRRTFAEHGDWDAAVQESQQMMAMDHLKAFDYLDKEGKLTPENVELLNRRYQEYGMKVEEIERNENRNGSPQLSYPDESQPSIKVGPAEDVNPTQPRPSILDSAGQVIGQIGGAISTVGRATFDMATSLGKETLNQLIQMALSGGANGKDVMKRAVQLAMGNMVASMQAQLIASIEQGMSGGAVKGTPPFMPDQRPPVEDVMNNPQNQGLFDALAEQLMAMLGLGGSGNPSQVIVDSLLQTFRDGTVKLPGNILLPDISGKDKKDGPFITVLGVPIGVGYPGVIIENPRLDWGQEGVLI